MVSLKFIIGLFIIILAVYTLAVVNNWYWIYRWIDIPLHFLGGLWLGMIFLYFVSPSLEIKDHKFLIEMLLVVGFAVFVGVLWEFFEFLFDVFVVRGGHLPPAQQGLADTMKDLFFDLFGGFVAFVAYRFQLKKNLV